MKKKIYVEIETSEILDILENELIECSGEQSDFIKSILSCIGEYRIKEYYPDLVEKSDVCLNDFSDNAVKTEFLERLGSGDLDISGIDINKYFTNEEIQDVFLEGKYDMMEIIDNYLNLNKNIPYTIEEKIEKLKNNLLINY